MKRTHIFGAGPTATYFLISNNGMITLQDHNHTFLLEMPVAQLRAEFVYGKDSDGVPNNFRVAIRIVQTPQLMFLAYIDPTLLAINGVACTSFAAFVVWFTAAMIAGQGSATITVSANGSAITDESISAKAPAAIIINDTVKNTGYTIAGSTLTFTDGTTVAIGEKVTVIY